jgi:hypothetical protein
MEDALVVGVVAGQCVQAADYAGDVGFAGDFFFHSKDALHLPVGFAHLGAGGVLLGRLRVEVAGERVDHLINAGAFFVREDGSCGAEPVLDGIAGYDAFAFDCFRTGGRHIRQPYSSWELRWCGGVAVSGDGSGCGGIRHPEGLRGGRF